MEKPEASSLPDLSNNILNEQHHRLVRMEQDPQRVLSAIDDCCQATGKLTFFTLQKWFGDIRFDPKIDTTLKFKAEYLDLVDWLRRCDDVTEKEVQQNLLIAIENAFLQIIFCETNSERMLTVDEIFLKIREELRRSKMTRREGAVTKQPRSSKNAMNVITKDRQGLENYTCHKCGLNSHFKRDCRNLGILSA